MLVLQVRLQIKLQVYKIKVLNLTLKGIFGDEIITKDF